MEVKSLGYQTDLIFVSFDGVIIDRGDYLVIKSPTNPSYYWGNFLLFDYPPSEGDFQRWPGLFAREIGSPPAVIHQTFGWDTAEDEHGVIEPFLKDGFHLEQSVVLTSQQPTLPSKAARGVTIRPLMSDDDYSQSIENQVVCREPEFTETEYRLFRKRQMKRYRSMTGAGLGNWFGAFIGNQLVADLGIFHSSQLGRYQYVQTHPDFRKQGIASQLVYESGIYALDQYGVNTLVIVADVGSQAERLYKAVGFNVVGHQLGIGKWKGKK